MQRLPESYISYLKNDGVTYGETDLEWAAYFDLEPLSSVQQMNDDIELSDYAPEFYAFASNGGGEVYVFDSRGSIYVMPLVGMTPDTAIKVVDSWEEFLSHVQNT